MTERDKFGTGQEVFENIAKAQELFPICNVDMIFGFRGQTDEILHRDLETLLKLSPRQITTYPLMVTSQTKRSVKDSIAAPHDRSVPYDSRYADRGLYPAVGVGLREIQQ